MSSVWGLEYQALRKVTGPYHGASHQKLGWIAEVEPLQSKLDGISVTRAAWSLRTGDVEIRSFLKGRVSADHTEWHDGTGKADFKLNGPINAASCLTPIVHLQERFYEDRQNTPKVPLTLDPILDPGGERSKHKGSWAGTIGGLLTRG